jgi:hypothetical protein
MTGLRKRGENKKEKKEVGREEVSRQKEGKKDKI